MNENAAAFVLDNVAGMLDPAMFRDENEGRRIISQIREASAKIRIAGIAGNARADAAVIRAVSPEVSER